MKMGYIFLSKIKKDDKSGAKIPPKNPIVKMRSRGYNVIENICNQEM
jgi:hypothetical protein